jgi:hypothetical protein
MEEKNDENTINENLIEININEEKNFKTFNIIKEIQNLLKKESCCKELCKIKFFTLSFSH